ncbi:MAG: hypothetical protein HC842_05725 [Cytophagales bacterium]|nr:hypothetical protein [Cytophagales bacterium]
MEGAEKAGQTYLRFSLPVEPASRYQKPLQKGRNYHLIMAFSRDDDFQHHSTMRTAVLIEL